jgi:hypothetical protein
MHRTPWRLALAVGLAGLLVAPPLVADDKPAKEQASGANSALVGQLKAVFASWDLNKDGFLDKAELAKAFRGPDAKPFDYTPKGKDADRDKPKDSDKKDADKGDDKDADKDAPKDSDKDDANGADKDPAKATSKSSSKRNYDDYPDYQFLMQLDKNGDERISREEWNAWAKDYAAQMKPVYDAEQRVLQAERKLAQRKPGSKQYRQAESELRHEREAVQKLRSQLRSVDRHVENVLKRIRQ